MTAETRILCWLLTLNSLASSSTAQLRHPELSETNKAAFNLFNPTPSGLLRELSVDGPGATESPYTVDAGHFQIEMSFADYTSEKGTFGEVDYRLDQVTFAPMNLKVGLLNSLDLQLLLEPYTHIYEREDFNDPQGLESESSRVTRRGFGSTTLRLKYNLWGNDGGPTALALTPFVVFPTSQEGIGSAVVEGGLTVPFGAELPIGFYLGLTTRLTTAQNILGGNDRHLEWGNSIQLAHELVGDLEGYVEFYSNVSTENEVGWAGRFDTGLIWWLTDSLQLNAGINIGVTKWADNLNFFVGFAWRY